ncbi:MAG: Cna B-type domain-containing protein [Coriobacteriia bacterium]|nr:Cna B-type domain-containing protein [Coriobacteriia bacterium]
MKSFANAGKRLRGVALFTVALSALLALAAVAPSTALAAINDQVPEHEKTITDNGDGTYDLSLTVKGAVEASTTSTKADVVVVQDVSGSMSRPIREVSSPDTSKSYMGVIGFINQGINDYVEVYYGKIRSCDKDTWYYKMSNGQKMDYLDRCKSDGRDPVFYETTWNEVVKKALNTLGDQLIENEKSDVQVSLVTYSTEAQADDVVYKGGDSDEFKAAVDQLTANGGTNWEDALAAANKKLTEDGRDGAKKYIVFVSDGLPTLRTSVNGFVQGNPWGDSHDHGYDDAIHGSDDRWAFSTGKYGTGSSDKLGRNYASALAEAQKIDSSVQMLLVNVSTDPTEMKKFASDINGTYYEGNNEVDGYDEGTLKNAFAKIANLVTNSASYENVKITDQLSDYVDFADVTDVRYEKVVDGVATTWDGAPKATVSGKTITWDLSGEGELEDGVTYKMTFTVKPNQNAYDAAAAAGAETELPSNDPDGTKLSYDVVAKKNNEEVDRYKGTDGYEEPTIKVPVATVTVTKEWKNTGDAQLPASVTVQLKKNGQNYGEAFQLTAGDNWTKTVTVPAGVGQLTWSVVEDAVPNYTTAYSDAVTGSGTLTVTNTYTGTKKNEGKKDDSGKDDSNKTATKKTKKGATPKTGDALLASEAIAAIAGTGILGVAASRIRRKK